ncbi:MAG: DUF1844 domain-containing protein [Phycisphaera sp.]|nr:DUF1844 domain-containing protein [Phycisphaera sp.]
MADDTGPKLHIDSDWKAQAQAEKEKLSEKAKPAAGASGASPATAGATGQSAPQGLPPANFETLISTMATQALFSMGAIPDPRTGQRVAHLDLARHHIDMLSVIEEKTRGNLTDEESSMLTGTLYELRSRYIQLATQARNR